MKNNMLKIINLVFVFSIIFVGCGGGGGDTTPATVVPTTSNPTKNSTTQINKEEVPANDEKNEQTKIVTTTITGTVVDGPIYDAMVSVYDINDTSFSNPLANAKTSSIDGKLGDYTLEVDNLPEQYILKVTGGKDTGPDGLKNDNDEESFEMSSVGLKSTPTTYITPATSMIANMVQDGESFDSAKANVKKSLGLPDGVDLTTTNPKTNDIANKAGTFVAQVLKSIPTTDTIQALKSITKEFKSKADVNKSVVTINSVDIVVNDLNLTSISNDVKVAKPDEIVEDDIEKLLKSSALLTKKIKSTVKKIKAVDKQTEDEKKEAIASHKALEKLSAQIKKEDIDTIDLNKLESLSIKYEDSFNAILEDGLDKLTNDNIDILADVIESNLDKNISSITTDLKAIALNTKELDDDSIHIYKTLYTSMDINESSKVSNLNKDDIKDIASSMDSESSDTQELLAASIASKLISVVKSSTGTIQTSKIDEIKTATVDNIILKDKFKSLSLQQKSLSKAQKQSATLALKNINKNFEKENFIFDNTAKNTIEELELKTKSQLQTLLADDTKSLAEIFDEIKAIEINANLIKLDVVFDENTFNTNFNTIKTVTSNLRTQKNINQDIDLTTSLRNIEEQFQQAIENNTSINDTATSINNNVNDYIKQQEEKKVYLEVPLFPTIGNFSMPNILNERDVSIVSK
jgi:hypothetical protein